MASSSSPPKNKISFYQTCLGHGTFGLVMKAVDISQTATAVKFIFPSNEPEDTKSMTQISRECTISLRLADHANIVKTLSVDEGNFSLAQLETIFPDKSLPTKGQQALKDTFIGKARRDKEIFVIRIQMELCGENLRSWLNLAHPDNSQLITVQSTIIKNLASGLEYLHDNEIIHRDFKPENVMFCKAGFVLPVKIGDFGHCRNIDTTESKTSNLTSGVGTRDYMAPEAFTKKYDKQADLFSLGLVIWEVVQLIPFGHRRPFFDRLVNDKEEDLVKNNAAFPDVALLIIQMTKRKVEDRLKSMKEVTDSLIDQDSMQNGTLDKGMDLIKSFEDKKTVPVTTLVKEMMKVELTPFADFRKNTNSMQPPAQQVAIGIDLGTSYSSVAICEPDGKVRVLNNSQNSPTTPCYIRLGAEDVVGEVAKSQALIYPSSTIFDAKRLVGRSYNDPNVQEDMKGWPFTVASDTSGTAVVEVDGNVYAPDTISAKLLTKLKEDAEAKLGKTVTSAVITVPAYFKDAQKQATKDAGIAAGLNVIELLTEPTAAAVAYSRDITLGEEKKILIFDFGGGTLDVSIISIHESDVTVLVTGGDNHFGGKDIDTKLMDYCMTKFNATNPNVDFFDGMYSTDPPVKEQYNRRLRRLRNECEKTKIALSVCSSTMVALDGLIVQGTTSLDLNVKVTVDEFNAMNATLFRRCISFVGRALMDGNLTKSDIDDVVLIGGSTRIPKIQRMLQDFFDGKPLNGRLNPDEAVVIGAAIRAGASHGYESVRTTIHDVTPMSIGIKLNGVFSIVFPKNSKYPNENTKSYMALGNKKTEVEVSIYEGEDMNAVNNSLLGKFILAGIPTTGKFQRVDVTMALDANGLLLVTARCEGNGVTKALTIRHRRLGWKNNFPHIYNERT
ncbi:heat shock 70 kDa protein-like isoform X2 [Folsomia candida]|uniref:heat shock 70 kDa protein-like isoform X2 n=1 Tax=Folsomia candida TaxID=158441 RepID=UPI0016053CEC|nr:heat shock 70 kDa protein-like isoform X2 [Folsomia candida]